MSLKTIFPFTRPFRVATSGLEDFFSLGGCLGRAGYGEGRDLSQCHGVSPPKQHFLQIGMGTVTSDTGRGSFLGQDSLKLSKATEQGTGHFWSHLWGSRLAEDAKKVWGQIQILFCEQWTRPQDCEKRIRFYVLLFSTLRSIKPLTITFFSYSSNWYLVRKVELIENCDLPRVTQQASCGWGEIRSDSPD